MNVQEIIKLAKYKTNTSDNGGNYDQDFILPQLNIVYKKIWRHLATGCGKYFWTFWNTNIIAGQNEYTLDSTEHQGMWKITGVSLLGRGGYVPLQQLEEIDEYHQGWKLRDNSIFLYPDPKESIAGGLRIYGIQNLPDLMLEGTEEDIFPGQSQFRDIHEILLSGLMIELREGKGDFDKADRERAKFNALLQDIVYDVLNREPTTSYSQLSY